MKKLFFVAALFVMCFTIHSQELTGVELIQKAIDFHDPNGKWETFNGNLFITMETPNRPKRDSEIRIDLPNERFMVRSKQAENVTVYSVIKENCTVLFNNKVDVTEEEKKKYNLNCERATMYKNYYTYLYGLPMKLKDKGTIIHPKVIKKTFKGKEYLVAKATYEKEVGEDTWYFYFNPKTYAMEVYQFFHDEAKNDGEYILLSDLEIINGIKIPKVRAWYYNKDNTYLGTDILKRTL